MQRLGFEEAETKGLVVSPRGRSQGFGTRRLILACKGSAAEPAGLDLVATERLCRVVCSC